MVVEQVHPILTLELNNLPPDPHQFTVPENLWSPNRTESMPGPPWSDKISTERESLTSCNNLPPYSLMDKEKFYISNLCLELCLMTEAEMR